MSALSTSSVNMGNTSILFKTSGDLWSKAFAQVGDKLPSEIFNDPDNKSLAELWAKTESSRQQLRDKSWSFKRKNDEVVYVRDLLVKASKWINHFKDIGDIVVQYDPVHAALPWAGVRFLLTVATGDLDTYKNLLDRTVGIMEVICRSAVVESLVGDNQHEAAESLREKLIILYTSILTYLAEANAYYKRSRMKSFIKNGLLASSDFESAFAAIQDAQVDVDQYRRVFQLQVQMEANVKLQELIQSFNAPINRWDHALHELTDHMDGEKREKILSWVSEQQYGKHHEQAKGEVLEGTGQWLLHDALFVHWKNECASSILWLHGIPGSGKSKLASIVIEDAIEAFGRQEGAYPAYFYCSRNNAAERGRSDPAQVLASIARQLSTPQRGGPILEPTEKEYEAEKNSMSGPLGLEKSKKLVLQLLQQYPSATIIMDALDECDPGTRGNLLKVLECLLKESPCLLKVFVTSRDDRDITYKLNNYPNLYLSSERNTDDINFFIRSETIRLIEEGHLLRDSNLKNELRDAIIDKLTSKARGMFRLASMQLQELCRQGTDRAIEERLERLPKSLEESYRETLRNIENMDAFADTQYARNALSWLLCARQQLKSDEFLSLVSVIENEPPTPISKGQLLQICSHFVIFDDATDTFRFSHLTVREFLEDHYLFKSVSINGLVAEACLSQLAQISIEGPIIEYPFLYWAEHAREASQQRYLRLEGMLKQFLQSEEIDSVFHRWHRTTEEILERRRTDRYVDFDDRIRLEAALSYIPRVSFVVCVYDLFDVLNREQWPQLVQQQYKNKAGETHQEVALRYGSGGLLEWQSRYDRPFEVTEEFLEIAAENEVYGKTVIALLLSNCKGAAIKITEEMVNAAECNGRSGESIMALLLESDAINCAITQEIVDAVVRSFSPSIFQQLCIKAGSQIFIKESTIMAAVANDEHSKDFTSILLDQSKEEIEVTEETVILTTRVEHGNEILALFLDHPKVRVSIGEDVLKAAAENSKIDEEVWIFLLNQLNPDVPIAEEIFTRAAGNYENGNMLITKLLDKRASIIPTTPTVVNAMVKHLNRSTMKLYLDKTQASISITKALIEETVMNWHHPQRVTSLLLERGTIKAENLEEVFQSLMIQSDATTFQEFLNRTGLNLQINEQNVEAAAQNWNYGHEMMALLLEKQGSEIPVTQQIIEFIFENHGTGEKMKELLVEKSANTIPTTEETVAMFARHTRGPTFQKLIDQRASDIPITGNVVEAVAAGSSDVTRDREEEFRTLFEKGCLEKSIVKDVIKSILSNTDKTILQLFIDQTGVEIEITEEITQAMTEDWPWNHNDMMTLLLEGRGSSVPISEEVVIAIAEHVDASNLKRTFCNSDTDMRISQELLQAAADNEMYGEEVMTFLLEGNQSEDLSITEEIVEAAAKNFGSGKGILALLLERSDGEIPITEEVLTRILYRDRDSEETLVLVLQKCRPKLLITEKVMETAARRSRTLLKILLDEQGTDARITEGMVNAAASCRRNDLQMALLLEKGGPGIPITENTMKEIVESEDGRKTLILFLERRMSQIPVTEEIIEKARNHRRYGDELVELLSQITDTNDNYNSLGLTGEKNSQEEQRKYYFQAKLLIEFKEYWSYLYLPVSFIVFFILSYSLIA